MRAFDTDILTQILRGNPAFADRVSQIPVAEQALPIVVAEELLRGRLNTIRQAEARKAKLTTEQAYQYFEHSLKDIRELTVVSTQSWLKRNIRPGARRSYVALRTICALPRFASLIRSRWLREIVEISSTFLGFRLSSGNSDARQRRPQ